MEAEKEKAIQSCFEFDFISLRFLHSKFLNGKWIMVVARRKLSFLCLVFGFVFLAKNVSFTFIWCG